MKRTECVRTRRRLALRMALLIPAALVLVFLLLEKNLEKVILAMAHAWAEAMAVIHQRGRTGHHGRPHSL